ncbi:GntR family transcriptional regulator [Neptunomonas phycophila]|uniref:GntR family transcriptional regulator n=1 Tax=Neptunomonas phycophila TaxID=1572645 RepID=A0AAW7XQQ6_9GAMM|nr:MULTISPECIES: GntR family transcriptional regulator [Neptunomonas]MDN2658874.1 GntR family transcriptional regulator [Neptunomonas sp. CHC150]MDO6455183.1 GntR family transcriptional regulator [Neptunomonas phycophila]MDO6468932.1 GntR family transcriptional regulator [Neptunomonas phycophila]MDP2522748.1 GntR family transcriptional regulator [Neptunomonas phycophila]
MSTKAQAEIERIMTSISQAIVDHRLPPGTRLVESKLVEALQANRNHVRAALQRLAAETKVVSILANRGAIVAQPSIKEARDIFETRTVLERAIVSLATRNLSARNKNRLLKQIEKEKLAIDAKDRQQMIRESGRFHTLLAEIAGNTVLGELLDGLIKRTSLIIALYQGTPDVQCTLGEHQALAHAILAGDESLALQLNDVHMHTIESHLLLNETSPSVDLKTALSVS